MTDMRRGMFLLRKWEREITAPVTFELLGREWALLPGVFNPAGTPVTGLFSSWLDYPVGGSFCEMGCGAGVTAVTAALAGCDRVAASDVSDRAVANTVLNAERHGVSGIVDVRHGDLFAPFGPAERFDVIFWNSNFTEAPAGHVNVSGLHHALFDPGYGAHRRFLEQAPAHLGPGGRLLLGFADIGNPALLRQLAGAAGLSVRAVRVQRVELEQPVEFQLLEFLPDDGGSWSLLTTTEPGSRSPAPPRR